MGGRAKYKKKIRARENLVKKILARQLTLKNIHAMAKKNSYKEFNNEKKIPAARKFPSPPRHYFSNGPSLKKFVWKYNK